MCFVLLVKTHAAINCKNAIFGFPVSPGSAEALVKWGWKIKYILIVYFLGNICAKNYCNRAMSVKIIASQRWDVFSETQWHSDKHAFTVVPIHHSGTNTYTFVTGSIARSANLPVFSLLRDRFWGFSPRRGDTLHRWGWNLARRRGPKCDISAKVPSSVPNFTPIGATTRV